MYLEHVCLILLAIVPFINAGVVNKDSYDGYYDDYDGYYNDGEEYKEYEDITFSPEDSPVIISKSDQFEFDNGETIKLPCRVHNFQDKIAIMWNKIDDEKISLIAVDDKIIDPKYQDRTTVTVDDKGSTLTIGQSKFGDSGKYQCELGLKNNRPQINHTVTIIQRTLTCKPLNYHADYWVNALASPPSVAVSKDFIFKDVGDMVEIVCIVQAVPIPEIDWVKDGQVLRSSHRFKISQFGDEHSLTIYPIQKRDFGIYICKARNSLGSEEQTIELKGIDYSEPEEILVAVGLSSSGHLESLKMVSSRKGLYPIIGKKPLSAEHFSIRFIQKTEEGWEEILVPYSVAASNSPIASKVLLFCSILMLLVHY